MTFKILFVFSSKPSISRLYQIASVEHSKDDTNILKETVLDPIGEGLREIVSGKRFVLQQLAEGNKLSAHFSLPNDDTDTQLHCNVPSSLVVVGDLKFYFQLLGRENMSGSWCCWCTTHPSKWKPLCSMHQHNKEDDCWTIAKLKDYKRRIDLGELKEAKDIKGVVDNPIWDFIEPSNFMFPQLHVEIGLINNVLDNLYEFVEEQIEVATPEQKVAKNKVIISDVGCARAKDRLLEWNSQGAVDLAMFRIQRTHLIAS